MKYSAFPRLACIPTFSVLLAFSFVSDLKALAIAARSVSWERVASADVIVQGELDLSNDTIAKLNSSSDYSEFLLPLKVISSAKGKLVSKKITVHYAPNSSIYAPSAKALANSNRQRLIAFLRSTKESNEFYFVGNHCSVIYPFANSKWLETTEEVKKQQNAIGAFSKTTFAKTNASDALVKQLLDNLTIKAKQEQAWDKLMKLKEDQLPVLVKYMNDTRSLNNFNIAIELPAPAIESIVHYSPPTVLDAVSILLNHKAQVNLRCLPAGGSAAARKATLESWEIWAVYSSQHKLQTKK